MRREDTSFDGDRQLMKLGRLMDITSTALLSLIAVVEVVVVVVFLFVSKKVHVL